MKWKDHVSSGWTSRCKAFWIKTCFPDAAGLVFTVRFVSNSVILFKILQHQVQEKRSVQHVFRGGEHGGAFTAAAHSLSFDLLSKFTEQWFYCGWACLTFCSRMLAATFYFQISRRWEDKHTLTNISARLQGFPEEGFPDGSRGF